MVREGCNPTISCTLAGGYCVKSPANCDGTVDRQGCRGKKCKCCIPDQTTPAPSTCSPCPTCPAVTSTPCPTSDQTTPAPSTCSPCPTCPAVTSTPCPTSGPGLNWLSVGADRFVRFDQKLDWTAGRTLCRSHGLDIYQPKDLQAVSKYLDENFSSEAVGNKDTWLPARGNGSHQVWFSGIGLTRDDPWYDNYYNYVGTDFCLFSITYNGWAEKGQFLGAYSCTFSDFYVICGC